MSAGPRSLSEEELSGSDDENSIRPACIQCRKRKRKCSRGYPCSACQNANTACVYKTFKKRGPRRGQIGSLSQRLMRLEAIVLNQGIMMSEAAIPGLGKGVITGNSNGATNTNVINSTATTTNSSGLQESDNNQDKESSANPDDSIDDQLHVLQHTLEKKVEHVRKRIKPSWDGDASLISEFDIDTLVPAKPLMLELLEIYFDQIHPWLPILHKPSFMVAFKNDQKSSSLVLLAITAVTVKFSKLPKDEQGYYYQECRKIVLLSFCDRFSIETLQASIIVAFDTIGSGRGPRSWSIVASMTRIVEQLGLATEEDDIEHNKLLNRIGFLKPSRNAAEREGRRRVFWSIFLMDRFCSVTTGWNTSMANSEIRRRLPVEGRYYFENANVSSRYFNLDETTVDQTDEEDSLGGYSYLVETTECLSKVCSFLMTEKSSFTSRQWFERFQVLDAMLVRWKTNLPLKWQRLRATSDWMDENLTLAHITHNTSVLLLHQNLAYPPRIFNSKPRIQSVHTCIAAAVEISNITENYLSIVRGRIVSPQFAFCVFIAGRTLLSSKIHGTRNTVDIERPLNVVIEALKTMSDLWIANGMYTENLAGQFYRRLKTALTANSEINASEAIFSDEEKDSDTNNVSLASPPVANLLASLNYSRPIMPTDEVYGNAAVIRENDELSMGGPGASTSNGNGSSHAAKSLGTVSMSGPQDPTQNATQGPTQDPSSVDYKSQYDYSYFYDLSRDNDLDYIFSWGDGAAADS